MGVTRALNRNVLREFDLDRKSDHYGKRKFGEGPMKTVLIYVNPDKQVGDPEHLKVFATADAAAIWFQQNNPEGVAFEYPVIGASSEGAGKPEDQFLEAPGG